MRRLPHLLLLLAVPAGSACDAGTVNNGDVALVVTRRASMNGSGVGGDGESRFPSISADGRYVAFVSTSPNLSPDDTDAIPDIFVKDLATGAIELASRADGLGPKGNAASGAPSLSGDGRFVAFESTATNLHPDDADGVRDIFVRDLLNRTTALASRATGAAGAKATADCFTPRLTEDGGRVVFISAASLHPDDPSNGIVDTYLRDLASATTILVSRAAGASGAKANNASRNPSISADGLRVLFLSVASNIHPDTSSGSATHAYVRDLTTHQNILADRAPGPAGVPANVFGARIAALSADGRKVAFYCSADNLLPEDTDNVESVFVRDLDADTLILVSRADGPSGTRGVSGGGYGLALSRDGRFVAFDNQSGNLVPADLNLRDDVFLRDTLLHRTTLLSVRTFGTQADQGAGYVTLSEDGRVAAFESSSTNLTDDDGNGFTDVFVRGLLR